MKLSVANITASIICLAGIAYIFIPTVSGSASTEILAFAGVLVGSASMYLFKERKQIESGTRD